MGASITPYRPIDYLNRERLNYLRSMANCGVTVAVAAALDFCREHKVPPPDWVMASSTELLCTLLKNERSHRRGRASSPVARYRQDMIDFSRWDAVESARVCQKDLLRQVQVMQEYSDLPKAYREDRLQLQAWYGTTLDRAFACAAMMLEGTEAFGSSDAIKRSYYKVRKCFAARRQAMRYGMLEPNFMPKLGLKWEPFVRPGRKIVPLYKIPERSR